MKKYEYTWFDPSCCYSFSEVLTENEVKKMYRRKKRFYRSYKHFIKSLLNSTGYEILKIVEE